MSAPEAAEPLFEAIIIPHRSLSRRGVMILCLSVAGLSSLLALRFWFIGAWPVAGFSVIEVGLFVFLLRLNVRHARQSELVLLTEIDPPNCPHRLARPAPRTQPAFGVAARAAGGSPRPRFPPRGRRPCGRGGDRCHLGRGREARSRRHVASRIGARPSAGVRQPATAGMTVGIY